MIKMARNDTAWNVFETLVKAGDETLEAILQNGKMPNPEELAGYEYNGYSTWWVTKPLGMAKFTKGFLKLDPNLFVGENTKRIGVYNIQTEMNELNGPWVHKRGKDGQRIHFGYGDVYPAAEDIYDNLYQNSLLINYGLNPSNSKHLVRNFRDYIVCAVGNNFSVLVGKSYTVFGPKLIPVSFMQLDKIGSYIADGALRSMPNYFVLIDSGIECDKKMEKFFSYYRQQTRMVRE